MLLIWTSATKANGRFFSILGFLGLLLLSFNLALLLQDHSKVANSLVSILLLLVFLWFNSSRPYRESVFSLLLSWWTFIFILIPLTWINFQSVNYSFGVGLSRIPYQGDEYFSSIPYAIIFLTILWVCLALAVKCRPKIRRKLYFANPKKPRSLGLFAVFVVVWSLVIAYLHMSTRLAIIGDGKVNPYILSMIFSSSSFLFLFSLLVCNAVHARTNRASQFLKFLFFIVFCFSVLSLTIGAASKGGILIIFNIMVIFTISYQKKLPDGLVLMPSLVFIGFLMLLSPIFFIGALDTRLSSSAGFDFFSSAEILSSLTLINEVGVKILDRLCYGGLDRFILVFHGFWVGDFGTAFILDFAVYLYSNLVNLVLPGTIYENAYAPSAQIFDKLLYGKVPNTPSSADYLFANLNTQPFTLFGLFILLFGFFSPVAIFVFGYALVRLYELLDSMLIRAVIISFFFATLSCFGFETNIANAIQQFFSMAIFLALYDYCSRIRLNTRRGVNQ